MTRAEEFWIENAPSTWDEYEVDLQLSLVAGRKLIGGQKVNQPEDRWEIYSEVLPELIRIRIIRWTGIPIFEVMMTEIETHFHITKIFVNGDRNAVMISGKRQAINALSEVLENFLFISFEK